MKRHQCRRLGGRAVGVLVACTLGLAVWMVGCGGESALETAEASDEAAIDSTQPEEVAKTLVDPVHITLFFPGGSGLLYPEPRAVLLPESVEAQAAVILREYLAGPRSEALARPFAEDVRLGGVYLSDAPSTDSGEAMVDADRSTSARTSSVIIVDLVSAESRNPPASGSREERQRVYGIVHSTLDNVESLSGVILLWNGRQRPSFAGHVDTGHILKRDVRLVAALR